MAQIQSACVSNLIGSGTCQHDDRYDLRGYLVNTDKSQVDANSIGGSRNGIFLDAQSTKNTILYNNVLKNDVDINNADGLPLNINGNELIKNNCFVSQPSGGCNPQ